MAEEVIISIQLEGDDAEKKVDVLTKRVLDLTKANKDLAAENKALAKAGQENTAEYVENSKQIEVNRQKIREASSSRRNLITTMQSEANSLKELKARNSELIKERDRLSTATAEGRAAIAAINTEIDKNNEVIRANSSAMEQQRMNVGNYKSALDAVVPGLGKFIDGIEGATKASLTFIATPIGIILGAIALALGSVVTWFKRTEEGGDQLKVILFTLEAVLGKILDGAAVVGEVLFKTFTDPQKAVQDFGKLIVDNIQTRLEGILELIPKLAEATTLLFEGKFAKAGQVAFDAVTKAVVGVENATDKLGQFASGVGAAVDEATRQGERLSALDKRLGDELRALTLQRAQTQLEVAKLREEAIKLEGAERRKVIEEAIALEQKLSDTEVAHARTKLAIAKEEQVINGITGESRQKVAEAAAAVVEAETQAFQNTLKFRKQLKTLDNEESQRQEQLRQDEIQRLQDIEKAEQEQMQNNLRFLEQQQQERLNKIKEDYLNQVLSKEEFEAAITQADIEAAEQRKAFLEVNGLATVEIEARMVDLRIKERDREIAAQEASDRKQLAFERATNQARIGLAQQLSNTLQAIAGKNKAIATAAVIIEKGAAIAQIVANTAIANAKAVAASPFTLGQPWVTLNTASGILAGVQVVAEAANAISQINAAQFAKGGLLRGPSHARGGIPFTVGGVPGFEAEGGEAIINKRSTAMFRPILSQINQAGGGVAFERGGAINPAHTMATHYQGGGIPSVAAMQSERIAEEGTRIERIVRDTIANMPPIVTLVEDIKERMSEYDHGANNVTIV